MDKKVQKIISQPNYRKIYTDILHKKFPQKMSDFQEKLQKNRLNALDIIKLNQIIFGKPDKQSNEFNQKHRSYDKNDILAILDHQRKFKLNNTQLAAHFNLSRNSVAKWKKLF